MNTLEQLTAKAIKSIRAAHSYRGCDLKETLRALDEIADEVELLRYAIEIDMQNEANRDSNHQT